LTEPTELDNGDMLHILPTGSKIDAPIKSLLGNGVIIDPTVLLKDFEILAKHGICSNNKKLVISDRINLVTAFHNRLAGKLSSVVHNGNSEVAV
jgi:adenylosuccinate synthase